MRGGEGRLGQVTPPLAFRFSPASPDTSYTFRVAAVDAAGVVGEFAVISETTPGPPGAPVVEGVEGEGG
jgi:chitodextrinase